MAEQVGGHLWATPKCGYTTASRIFREIFKPIDYSFIVIRNPYSRMVSFYTNSVVYHIPDEHGNTGFQRPREDYPIAHLNFGHQNWTFRQMVERLSEFNMRSLDRHLHPQSKDANPQMFDYVVRLETFRKDILEVAGKLELSEEQIQYALKEHANKTPKNPDITEPVYDKKAEWLFENGTPTDWRLFYNQNLADIVYNLYKTDFDMWGYEKLSV